MAPMGSVAVVSEAAVTTISRLRWSSLRLIPPGRSR